MHCRAVATLRHEQAIASSLYDRRHFFDSPKCDKCVWRPDCARSRWGSFSAPPDLLAAIWGGVLLLRGRERGGEGRGIASSLFNLWLRA